MKEAMFYERGEGGEVQCRLCPQQCKIPEGDRGVCCVRENRSGTLYSLVYGRPVSTHVDPIEKKPLFHFMPGSRAFSIATVGCNLRCLHCQNHDISQAPRNTGSIYGRDIPPERIVEMAAQSGSASISSTYTEPTIYFEYALEVARLAHARGLKNNFVTNGYTALEALDEVGPYLDGANVDLKSFSESFYKKICGASLKPVLESIRKMKSLGIWVEVTTLLIPGKNDSPEELREIAEFIREAGAEIPWHISAFHPTYRMLEPPRTSARSIRTAMAIGREAGLKYVYAGNLPGDEGESTYCYSCGELLIERYLFQIHTNRIRAGRCPSCKATIDGIEMDDPG